MARVLDRRIGLAVGLVVIAARAVVGMRGCQGGTRLVEVFDVGPPGGPRGESQGYRWVGVNEEPPSGHAWKTVDFEALTPEQRARIR